MTLPAFEEHLDDLPPRSRVWRARPASDAIAVDVKIQSVRSTTLNREDLRRGVEADECYYVANEPAVRHREDIDLARDPPPDLVVEIEVSRRVLGRLPIDAAIGIPEVWRYDGKTLRVSQLGDDGEYHLLDRVRMI